MAILLETRRHRRDVTQHVFMDGLQRIGYDEIMSAIDGQLPLENQLGNPRPIAPRCAMR
jgi:hypothetical protein